MSARIPEGSRSYQASQTPKTTGKVVNPSRDLVEGADQAVEATEWLSENCDNVLRGMMTRRELNQKSITELGPDEEKTADKSARCLAANLKMCGEEWLSFQQRTGTVQTAPPAA